MITAVDTNVLLDVFLAGAPHGRQSRDWLRDAYDRGAIRICNVVYAELVPVFGGRASLDGALRELGVAVTPIDNAMAYEAGMRWLLYRRSGDPRKRILTDFLIGAHALSSADAFLTRDRGFSRYFPELTPE